VIRKLGLRGKVLIIFTSVTLLGGLSLFLTAGLQLQDATLEFYQQDLQASAFNMASRLADSMGEEDEALSGKALQSLLEKQTDSKVMYTVLDASGRVVASTYLPLYALAQPLPNTPELAAALAGRTARAIRDSETGEERAYVAVPIVYEGQIRGVVRVAAPMSTAYRQARNKWYQLTAVAMPILFLTVGASLWLGRTLTQPIKKLNTTALRIAEGAFDERVAIKSGDEIGQLGSAFNFMAERINALLTAQRSFVSNAAHELRNPLMGLKLRCEALRNQPLSEEQKTLYMSELAQEIEHMSTLITQLLILARLDEGHHQADQPPEDTIAFLQDAARTWRIRASAAELKFEADIPSSLPDIQIAASDLQIILENLLGNAVKYTPRGGQIALHATSDKTTFRLTVRDSGEGFSPEEGARLFGRFTRLAHARETNIPGTGLGLSIAKAILEQYGGTITAHSDGPNQGAAFEVSLPLVAKAAG
jgi:signal transduction histidine kinase